MRHPWILTVADSDGALDRALQDVPAVRVVRSLPGPRAVVLAAPADAERLRGHSEVVEIVPDRLEHRL